ncbi:MAG: hypothetical protein J5780_02365, partial [Treponema sp.]|nr:hypothetical protein [Treponema sp.]
MNRKKTFFFLTTFILTFAVPVSAKKSESETIAGAVFKKYPSRFAEINSEALALTIDGNFADAAEAFSKTEKKKPDAFGFMRDSYSAPSYEVKKTDEEIGKVKNEISKFIRLQGDIQKIKTDIESAKDSKKLTEKLLPLIEIRNSVAESGQIIKRNGSSPYITYLSKSILGIDEDRRTGILGVMDSCIDSVLEKAKKSIEDESISYASSFAEQMEVSSLFKNTDMEKAKECALALKKNAEYQKKIHEIYALLEGAGRNIVREKISFSDEMDFLSTVCTESSSIQATVKSYRELKKTNLKKPDDPVNAVKSGKDTYSEELIRFANSFLSFSNTAVAQKKSQPLVRLRRMENIRPSSRIFADSLYNASEEIEKTASTLSVEYWKESAAYYALCAEGLYNSESTELTEIEKLIDSGNEVKYSQRALDRLPVLEESIRNDIKHLDSSKVKLSDGYAYRSSFLKESREIDTTRDNLQKLFPKLSAVSEKARSLKLDAVLAKNEVTVFYERASRSYNTAAYDSAMDNLQKAKNSYDSHTASLNNDGDLKENVYSSIILLKDKIIEKKKPEFFKEQRNLKTKAKRSYDSGNFENASLVITQIEEKRSAWEKLTDLPIDRDMELERLKDFVNTALEIKGGREISPYDTKAPEMNRNLSLADEFYQKGSALMQEGKTQEGKKLLENAKEKVSLVKTYYPRNKDAGLLTLKIERLLDKENFDAVFPMRVESCVKEINGKTPLAVASYSDLLSLYELNSSYPGLKKHIENAEYSLG